MREIEFTTHFQKDFKREKRNPRHKDLDKVLEGVIDSLLLDKQLARKFLDHALKGEYADCRECHLKPDLLMIYSKSGKSVLSLIRLGSHSELF
jgi:mRNA interferase YafQ